LTPPNIPIGPPEAEFSFMDGFQICFAKLSKTKDKVVFLTSLLLGFKVTHDELAKPVLITIIAVGRPLDSPLHTTLIIQTDSGSPS
jgi:hypothetical protein